MMWLTRDWSGTCVSCGRQRRTDADIDRALVEYDGVEPAWWASVCWWVDAALCFLNPDKQPPWLDDEDADRALNPGGR